MSVAAVLPTRVPQAGMEDRYWVIYITTRASSLILPLWTTSGYYLHDTGGLQTMTFKV